ncbi:ArsR/SmtB family transcription factor [Planctomycetota bacterium]
MLLNNELKLAEAKAQIFKALGHPVRLMIVEALEKRSHCVCELVDMVPGAQATTSRHLNVLLRSGIVWRRKEGVRVMYGLAMPCLLKALPCVVDALRGRLASETSLLQ